MSEYILYIHIIEEYCEKVNIIDSVGKGELNLNLWRQDHGTSSETGK